MGLETIALAASLGSAAISGIGAIQQGNAASASAGYNAQIAANNAKIAKQNAGFAGAEGEYNVGAQGARTAAQVGTTLANQGASGIDVNSGSAVSVRESEAKVGMLNALNIRSEAARKAYGYQTEGVSDTAQSQLDKSQAASAKTGGYLSAAGTVLGGVGNAGLNYGKFMAGGDPTGGITGSNYFADATAGASSGFDPQA